MEIELDDPIESQKKIQKSPTVRKINKKPTEKFNFTNNNNNNINK